MRRITYVGTSVLVSDEFGDVMLEYAASLARANTSETLRFRGVSESDLRAVEYNFIIGPASEIVVESIGEAAVEQIDNADAIAHMRRRMTELADAQKKEQRPGDREGGTERPAIRPEPATQRSPLIDGLDI